MPPTVPSRSEPTLGTGSRPGAPTETVAAPDRWQRADTLAALALAVLLAAAFLATASYGPAQVNDTRAATLGGWSLGTQGTVVLPEDWPASHNYWGVEGRDGGVIVNRFPGVAYWSAPAYGVAALAALVVDDAEPPAHPFLVSPVPAAVTAALTAAAFAAVLFVLLRRLTSRRFALAGTLTVALGTSVWSVAADALWPHAPAMLALAGLLLAWRRDRPALAAGCAAVAVLVRPHLVVAVAVLALFIWLREHRRDGVVITGGALAGLVALSAYSAATFGTILPVAGYDVGGHVGGLLSHSPWQTVRGLALALSSPDRGLLVFSPVLVPALVAVVWSWRRLPGWTRASAIAGLVYLVVQVRAVGYRGGEGFFAYRVSLEALLLAAPALLLAVREAVTRWRLAASTVGLLAVLSVAIHAYGAVVGGVDADTTQAWEEIQTHVREQTAG